MRRRLAFAITCVVLAGSLLTAGSAGARTINPYVYSGSSFNGADSTAGAFENPSYIAINKADGRVYVLDAGNGGTLTQFNASGEAMPFSAPSLGGASSMTLGTWQKVEFGALGTGAEIAVDNSGTETQGRIFAMTVQPSPSQPLIFGFDSSGASLGPNWPVCGWSCGKSGNWGYLPRGIATDPDGTPWVASPPFEGTPPHTLTPIDVDTGFRSETKERLTLGQSYVAGTGHTQCCRPGSTAFYPHKFAFDSDGSIYVTANPVIGATGYGIMKYDASGELLNPAVTPQLWANNSAGGDGQLAVDDASHNLLVNRNSRVEVYAPDYTRIDSFGALTSSTGVAVNPDTKRVYVTNRAGSGKVDIYEPGPAVTVPDVATEPATGISQKTATLTGIVDPDAGGDTTECFFRYSAAGTALNRTVPCAQGKVLPSAGGAQEVTATISELDCQSFFEGRCFDSEFGSPPAKGLLYFYSLVTKNGAGPEQIGRIRSFRNGNKPTVGIPSVHKVNSDGVTVGVTMDPQGGETDVRIEVGTTEAYGRTVERKSPEFFSGARPDTPEALDLRIDNLEPDTTYHYRVIVENMSGVAETADRTFRTFAVSGFDPSCSNTLSRQQTGAAQLLDCRSYELTSANDQGGYNVVSDQVPGQKPFQGYPRADDKVLYGMSGGGIPGTGTPTNRGTDPYVASRTAGGWITTYVGIPGDNPFSVAPFSSPVADADSSLGSFVFAGEDICAPCFADGSSGIPVRMPGGGLRQGMAGSLPVSDPTPAGEIRKPMSADGSHLVFGSEDRFEPEGNEGELSIFLRDLNAGTTEVVSKTPAGTTMSGADLAALDISEDGSHVLIGERLSTDIEGTGYFHLYMNVGASDSSIDLTPGASAGAVFAGMSGDGSEVYFMTRDQLGSDTDNSTDLYRADISGGSAALTRLSVGVEGTGDTDVCNAAANWNTPSGGPNCNAVPVAGGGGVPILGGALYFFSPEQLDGAAKGTPGQPNLYLSTPGAEPRFVTTLSVTDPVVIHAVKAADIRDTADFQTNATGTVAAFTTSLPIKPGYENRGFGQVYSYDSTDDALTCISCPITNAPGRGPATLATNGLSVTDDGRLFFNAVDPLVLRDSNEEQDVYEYSDGVVELISSGTDANPSSLLSATADGEDVFFFTRETLAPQDENGPVLKIYDAREEGGFFVSSPQHPCKASDECHGAGTVAAPPAVIQSTQGTPGQAKSKKRKHCRKGSMRKRGSKRKRGKCVARKKAKKHRTRGKKTGRGGRNG